MIAGRGAAVAGMVAIAAAISFAVHARADLVGAAQEGVEQSARGFETVAALLANRSPGSRPEGALAILKAKRQAAIHERALPKLRGPLAAAPVIPPVLAAPVPSPLYDIVAGPPVVALAGPPPIDILPPGAGAPNIFLVPPPPGGGGGGGVFIPPPQVTTPETPTVPVTPPANSAVPEPATWLMMLIGFVFIGRPIRGSRKVSLRIGLD